MSPIVLNGRTYRVVRLGDARVVIVQTGPRTSRLALPYIARMILSGLDVRAIAA